MVFWGIEVKPGQAFTYDCKAVPERLHITQATLGAGSSSERSVLQCVVGGKSPVFLCSLLPDKFETCPLNLEYEEDDEVSFSTVGPRSIHLSGFIEIVGDDDDFEPDSYGEDIADSDTDASIDYSTEGTYDDDMSDEEDDRVMYPPSPVPNSGVIIEEIVDDEKPAKPLKKRLQQSGKDDNDASRKQIVPKHDVPMSESEDEDGFPVSDSFKSKVQKEDSKAQAMDSKSKNPKKKRSRDETGTKTNTTSENKQNGEESKLSDAAVATDNNDQPKKKKKNSNKQIKEAEIVEKAIENNQEIPVRDDKMKSEIEVKPAADGDVSEEKKKRKKKKKSKVEKREEEAAAAKADLVEKQTEAKASHIREFPNGLVIEDQKMGKPDGKRASPGKRVSVNYIGKLKKNGSIFDSNVGRAPFKFRLGVGQVIKGWDVGINGMRVGDKRRLTIPPSMGYGAAGAGHKIPPNSWLVFDVELLDVN
uniref:FK506-binding protein n=1 Tax=Kalanchoe fedtschenkoi TaxID=63787 RepID=A0A7N0RDY6_KALFE